MKEQIFEIEELINKSGYDTFIKDESIHIVKDGKVTDIPIKNINILLEGEITPKSQDIALLIINNHNQKVKLEEGFYDNEEPMSKSEIEKALKKALKDSKSTSEREDIENKLDLSDPEIKHLHNQWDNGDCSLVGIVEIYLYQCIKKHKEKNGSYYDADYDLIKLRYGNK